MRQMPLERYRAVLRAPGVPGLLVVGFLANLCVRAVDKRHHMEDEDRSGLEAARAA